MNKDEKNLEYILAEAMEESEKILRKSLSPLLDDHSSLFRLCHQKFSRNLRRIMGPLCDRAGSGMREKAQRLSPDPLEMEFKINLQTILKVLESERNSIFHRSYVDEFLRHLDIWRVEQIHLITRKLCEILPEGEGSEPNLNNRTGPIRIARADREKQAHELAVRIVNLVYSVRKKIWENYRTEPVGGNLGNLRDIVLKSENISGKFRDMQCGDWSDLFLKGLEISIDKWYYNNANSFIVEHINTPGLNLPGNNLLSNLGEHNLIRIRTGRKSIYIDPWKSGGRKILKEEKEINIQKYKVFDNNGIKTGYPVPGGIILNQNHTKGKKRNFSHTIFQCFL